MESVNILRQKYNFVRCNFVKTLLSFHIKHLFAFNFMTCCLCVGLIRKSEAIDEAKIKTWKVITMINTKKLNYGSLAEGLDFKLEFWHFERESLRACKWRENYNGTSSDRLHLRTEKCNPDPLLLLRLTEIEKELQAYFRKR